MGSAFGTRRDGGCGRGAAQCLRLPAGSTGQTAAAEPVCRGLNIGWQRVPLPSLPAARGSCPQGPAAAAASWAAAPPMLGGVGEGLQPAPQSPLPGWAALACPQTLQTPTWARGCCAPSRRLSPCPPCQPLWAAGRAAAGLWGLATPGRGWGLVLEMAQGRGRLQLHGSPRAQPRPRLLGEPWGLPPVPPSLCAEARGAG